MSMNQYRGKEETDKIDFAKLTPEEQKKASKEKANDEKQSENTNEDIAEKAKKAFDKDMYKNVS